MKTTHPIPASLLLVLLVAPAPASAESYSTVEGEHATPVNPDCSSDIYDGKPETTQPRAYGGSSGGSSMLMPNDGCSVSYTAARLGGAKPVGIRFTLNGRAGSDLCGSFTFSGLFTGSTSACGANDSWFFNTLGLSAGSGDTLTITFHNGEGYLNAYFDQLLVCSGCTSSTPPPPEPSCPVDLDPPGLCAPEPPGCLVGHDADCLADPPRCGNGEIVIPRDPIETAQQSHWWFTVCGIKFFVRTGALDEIVVV